MSYDARSLNRRFALARWLGPLCLALAACTPSSSTEPTTGLHQTPEPWNLLLVTFDTTRADRIGCYGNQRIETPTLDSLAGQGALFAQTFSAVPITAPSHSTILTGRYPIAHGVRDNGLFVLGDEQVTLAEILRDHGYETAAAIGAFPLSARFGLDQGFSFFDDHLTGGFEDYLGQRAVPKERLFFDERRAAQVNESLLPWLTEHAEQPFFAWVHYFDPHQPFEPAPPYDQIYADDLYNGEIAYADSRVGFLLEQLDRLDVLDRTLVVMTADHGEGLGEHNELTHAVLAYSSTLHVPLIIRPPTRASATSDSEADSLPTGVKIEQRVGTVDIVPTVLELLGIDAPPGLQGRSLVPLWHGATTEERTTEDSSALESPTQYAENLSPRLTHGWGELRVLFDGPLKYIHGPTPELYDLETDPGEKHNLIDQRSEDSKRLRNSLESFLEQNAVAGVSTTEELDDEVRQRLEALGYLHSSAPSDSPIIETLLEGGIAPRDRVGDVNDLSAAKHLLFEGRPKDALVYTGKLTQRAPHSPLYLELHVSALTDVGRLDEAWQAAQRLADEGTVPEPMMLQLSSRRFTSGLERQAIDSLNEYLKKAPGAKSAWLLASFHRSLGEPDATLSALEQALDIDENFVPARVDLGVHFAESGDVEAAEKQFEQALESAPYYAKGYYNYGTLALQNQRFAEARGYFSRAVALAPRYLKAHLALVAVNIAAEDWEQAEQASATLAQLAPRSQESITATELLADR